MVCGCRHQTFHMAMMGSQPEEAITMTGKQFRALAVLTVVSGFLGGAVVNLVLRGGPAMAQAGGAVPEVVRAGRFEVVDDQGVMRAAFGHLSVLWNNNPGLFLYDAAGKTRAELFLGDHGSPGLVLSGPDGLGRAAFDLEADGSPGVTFIGTGAKQLARFGLEADGSNALSLQDAAGKTRVKLGLGADGSPGMALHKKDGTVAWHAP